MSCSRIKSETTSRENETGSEETTGEVVRKYSLLSVDENVRTIIFRRLMNYLPSRIDGFLSDSRVAVSLREKNIPNRDAAA